MVRTYTPPDFNLLCDMWILPNSPVLGAPDLTNVPCQAYVNPRLIYSDDFWNIVYQLRFPLSTTRVFADYIFDLQVPNLMLVRTLAAGNCHVGFPNEYKIAHAMACLNDGTLWSGVALP